MTALTEGQRLYVIGDVHGRLDLLTAMLDRIRADIAVRPHPLPRLILLGDYVDRGPDSRGVLDALIALRDGDLAVEFLFGNHDSYVPAYLDDPEWLDRSVHWLHGSMGGAATLASYGIADAHHEDPVATHAAFQAAFPAAHAAFLSACRLSLRIGGYIFVHAGIRPGVALEDQSVHDLIWIREPFLSSPRDHGAKVVHGHTIVPRVEHRHNRIAIDTGAVRHGVLTCLVLEDADVAVLGAEGPVPCPETGRGLAAVGAALRGRLSAMRGPLHRGGIRRI